MIVAVARAPPERSRARAAAPVVLPGTGHGGKSYELAGDEAYTLAGLAAELSRQTGRPIPYRNLREAEYAAALAGAGLPDGLARVFAGYDTAAAQGALFDDGRQLSALIGRPPPPLRAAVAQAIEAARRQAA